MFWKIVLSIIICAGSYLLIVYTDLDGFGSFLILIPPVYWFYKIVDAAIRYFQKNKSNETV